MVRSLSSTNRFNSPSGDSMNGWETWSPYTNVQAIWNAGSQLTDGSLTINSPRFSGHTDSYVQAYKGIKAVAKSKSYLVRFDVASPAEKKIAVFIRQRQAPYQDLTRRYEFMAGPVRKRYEFALTVSASEADALLTFQLSEDNEPVQLGNIQLQEAIIEVVSPDDLIRLVCNPTTKDSTVVLSDAYRDVKNHYYGRQVALKPFTSVVLLRDTLPPVDVRLSLKVDHDSLQLGEVTSVSLTLHNASANRSPLSNQVQWSCRLPAGITLTGGINPANQDSLLTGTAQRLLSDTTFVFRVKATATGRYKLAAQVTAATYADPSSTPDSGTDDGEDDQASVGFVVGERRAPATNSGLVTALTGSPLEKNLIYPNPASDEFTFVAEEDIVTIRLVDVLGRERLSLGSVRRGHAVRFGRSLPDAPYLLHIQYKTGEQRTVKLVKQRL